MLPMTSFSACLYNQMTIIFLFFIYYTALINLQSLDHPSIDTIMVKEHFIMLFDSVSYNFIEDHCTNIHQGYVSITFFL